MALMIPHNDVGCTSGIVRRYLSLWYDVRLYVGFMTEITGWAIVGRTDGNMPLAVRQAYVGP